MRIRHEAIYTYLYVLPRGALKKELLAAIRQPRPQRRPRSTNPERRGRIPDMSSIEERPAEVADRTVPGHWEGDLLVGRRNASALRRSLTYDQGKEMSEHRLFTEETAVQVYFAHPHSPWERGTSENTNGHRGCRWRRRPSTREG